MRRADRGIHPIYLFVPSLLLFISAFPLLASPFCLTIFSLFLFLIPSSVCCASDVFCAGLDCLSSFISLLFNHLCIWSMMAGLRKIVFLLSTVPRVLSSSLVLSSHPPVSCFSSWISSFFYFDNFHFFLFCSLVLISWLDCSRSFNLPIWIDLSHQTFHNFVPFFLTYKASVSTYSWSRTGNFTSSITCLFQTTRALDYWVVLWVISQDMMMMMMMRRRRKKKKENEKNATT